MCWFAVDALVNSVAIEVLLVWYTCFGFVACGWFCCDGLLCFGGFSIYVICWLGIVCVTGGFGLMGVFVVVSCARFLLYDLVVDHCDVIWVFRMWFIVYCLVLLLVGLRLV